MYPLAFVALPLLKHEQRERMIVSLRFQRMILLSMLNYPTTI